MGNSGRLFEVNKIEKSFHDKIPSSLTVLIHAVTLLLSLPNTETQSFINKILTNSIKKK